jgi:hypothetical protein
MMKINLYPSFKKKAKHPNDTKSKFLGGKWVKHSLNSESRSMCDVFR